jgi:cobyrinic acid a,c-diamide synthase
MSNTNELTRYQLVERLDDAMLELANEKVKVHILHQQSTDLRREKHQLATRLEKASAKMEELSTDLRRAQTQASNKLRGQ